MDTQWFNSLLNNSTEGIIGVTDQSRIKFINNVAQRIIGLEEREAVDQGFSHVIRFKNPHKLDFFNEELQCCSDTDHFEDALFNHISKEFIPISGMITSIRDNGKFKGKLFILKNIKEIKKLFERVEYHSSHDPLTDLYNREHFIGKVASYISISKFDNSTHGLLILNIDKFKLINDTCGHTAGDELLRKISYTIKNYRGDEKFILSRIGGDEFGIILPGKSEGEIKHIAKGFQRRIKGIDFLWGDKTFSITCSMGLAFINSETVNHHTLIASLDDACAIAKERGGDRIEVYSGVDETFNKRRGEMKWIHILKESITQDNFILYYQEIKALEKSNTRKIEILLRLKTDDGSIKNPGDFIPPAESYGLMPEIDKVVIEKSMEACKEIINNKGIKDNYIFSVNISGLSILDRSLPSYIISAFQRHKVPPTLFNFEITETATIKNLENAKILIKTLKQIGCSFSLDDFGSGFSNFSYLKSLNVDFLKIDGSFIKNLIEEPVNIAIVESINKIGHTMGLKTIAEFVSTKKIFEEIENIGVDYIQGYYNHKPTPITELFK